MCIIDILEKIGFKHTTNELSISRALINNKEMLLARKDDDFRFAAEDKNTVDAALQLLRDEGVRIEHVDQPKFNGLDTDERKECVRLHVETHVEKAIEKLDFKAHVNHIKLQKVPIADATVKELEESYEPITQCETSKLEKTYGFKYRTIIGIMLFAYTACRVDIGCAISTL